MLRTRFTDLLGLDYPVMSAPMSNHSGGQLAAAVSLAGGLGTFGGTNDFSLEWLDGDVNWTVGQALRSPAFWLLVGYEVLAGMSIGALIIHRIPYVTDLGFSHVQAGISFGIYGVCAFAAKLAWGFLADRYSIWSLAVIALVGSAVSIFAGVGSTNVWQLHGTFGVLYGLTGGSLVVVGPLLWAAHFGRQHLGTIKGVMSPFYLVASIGGPMFAALVYDHLGSYDAAWRFFSAYFLVAAILVGTAGRMRHLGSPVGA